MVGWKGKLLSMDGKLALIKSVLSSIPIYIFAVVTPPIKVAKEIHSLFANFLWEESEEGVKHHSVS